MHLCPGATGETCELQQAGLFCGLSSVDSPLCGVFPSSQGFARCGSCGSISIGEILQNMSPRKACLKSTIKHTHGLSPGFSLGSPRNNDANRLDDIPSLTPASLATPQGVNAVPLHTAKPRESEGGSNCFSRTGRGICSCSDLIVFFHSYCFDHMRAIGSPYNLTFPNPGSCRDLSFN